MAKHNEVKIELDSQNKLKIQLQADGSTTFSGQFTDRETMLATLRLGWTSCNPVVRAKKSQTQK